MALGDLKTDGYISGCEEQTAADTLPRRQRNRLDAYQRCVEHCDEERVAERRSN